MSESESENKKPAPGTIGWIDMATENADQIRAFYESVVGWQSEAVPVEDHQDFVITPSGGSEPVAGICHNKGPNADTPGGWMIYIHVDDLKASLDSCVELGGEKVGDVRVISGYGKTCVIKDPSGAMCVLFESL
ncbi:VOC family protein [Mariniblastus fucicola]|uniref:27 kDa antigen Cfp30B n=1 Tax=Mariniblastus fucicola TaxID=980251 RepID=A0A5B9P7C5_9BACT|nr:VOC family protein [Mariniblastus fucicola]QEG21095.1 27 kDa antigen Cfp30B [Mariniblastus fucicola]